MAIGNPEGLNLTFTVGVVEGIRPDPSTGSHLDPAPGPRLSRIERRPAAERAGRSDRDQHVQDTRNAQNLNGAIQINDAKPYLPSGAATMTWQQFRASGAGCFQGPTSGQAAPPRGGAPSEPGSSFFMKVSDYRSGDNTYKIGFTAGVYDTVSLFAVAAQGPGGIDNKMLLALFQCVNPEVMRSASWRRG